MRLRLSPAATTHRQPTSRNSIYIYMIQQNAHDNERK